MTFDAIGLASAFFSGLLAGEELAICLGVRQPLADLATEAHIAMRQGLIRRLRVLVPILFACALVTGIASTLVHPAQSDRLLSLSSVALLLLFIGLTLSATVPINKAIGRWNATNPPQDWQHVIRRWEKLDNMRTALAVMAFVLALLGL